jgi:hypothetical protein
LQLWLGGAKALDLVPCFHGGWPQFAMMGGRDVVRI